MNLKFWKLSAGLLVLTVFALSVGCKKNDPDPVVTPTDLAVKILGTYKIYLLGQNNPSGGPVNATRTGNVVITRKGTALDQVNFNVTITRNSIENGAVVSIKSAEDKLITLKDAGKALDLYDGTTAIGGWAKDTVSVRNYSFNGEAVSSKTIDFAAAK